VDGSCGKHGGVEGCCKLLVGRPEGRDHWEDVGVGERITLRWTLWSRGRCGELHVTATRRNILVYV